MQYRGPTYARPGVRKQPHDPWPEAWEPDISEVQDSVQKATIVYAVVPTVDGLGRTVKREVPGLKHRQQVQTAVADARALVRDEAKAVYAEQRLAYITTQRLEGEQTLTSGPIKGKHADVVVYDDTYVEEDLAWGLSFFEQVKVRSHK